MARKRLVRNTLNPLVSGDYQSLTKYINILPLLEIPPPSLYHRGLRLLKVRPKPVQATSKEHLRELIKEQIQIYGSKCDLHHIDISKVNDMSGLFSCLSFQGDISRWDVSNVTDMSYMFSRSLFNQDISRWNTKSVTTMESMFSDSYFSQDISRWNVANVQNMSSMFSGSSFSSDISSWRVHPEAQTYGMFFNIEKESLKGLNLPNTPSFILKLLNYEDAKQWVDGHKESIYHWQFYLAAFEHDVEVLNDDVKDHLDQYRALLQGLDLGLLKSADFLHQAWQQRVSPCVEQSIEPFNFMP